MAVTQNKVVLPQNVKSAKAVVTTAKTNLSDTSNVVKLIASTDVPNGGRVVRIYAIGRASNTATQLQLYRSYDSGVTVFLSDSALLPAYTLSGSTAITKGKFSDYSEDSPMRLNALEEIWVATGTNLATGIIFIAEYEAY